MGHEFAGVVVDVGADAEASLLGRLVTVFPLLPCFRCEPCLRKAYAQCIQYHYYGSRNDGAYTKYLAVQQWNVLPLPMGVDVSDGALTEPVAVALHGLNRLELSRGVGVKRVLIVGAGFIGLVGAEMLRMLCPDILITVADRNQYKLDLISDPMTEKVLLEPNDGLEGSFTKLIGQFDVVIEATGAPSVFCETIRLVRPAGRVLWMGNIEADLLFPQALVSMILRKEISILGTWNSSYAGREPSDWTQALELMANGLRPTRYVSDFICLRDVPDILLRLNERKTNKIKNNITKAIILPHDE
jgi:L-iditol 2-dehydrogenase